MKAIIEGILFLSGDDGISIDEIANITNEDKNEIKKVIKELYNDYEDKDRGIRLEYLGEKFKLTTKAEHKEYYAKLVNEENNNLSDSTLEVLAIIAYSGPITRIDVDNIRGVNSSYIVRKLLIKGLIEECGRSDAPGRPRIYKVTNRFLDYFGLGSIDELPKIEKKEDVSDEEDLFESKYQEI